MSISPVKPDNIESIKAIAQSAMYASVEASSETKNNLLISIQNDIEKYLTQRGCYLKFDNGSITGYILVKEYWNLAHLFVMPSVHNTGIGKALWSSALEICRKENTEGFIRVNSSLNAEKFYKKLGFSEFTPEQPVPTFAIPLIYWLDNEKRKETKSAIVADSG